MRFRPKFESLQERIVPTVYNIGPGYTYTHPAAFYFGRSSPLAAGDEVDIHAPEDGSFYSDRLGITVATGTPASNIVIKGIANSHGALPTFQQHNTGSDIVNSDYYPSSDDNLASAQVCFEVDKQASSTSYVSNITFEYFNFVGEANTGYQPNGIGIYRGDKIHILHNNIWNFADGIFGKSYGSPGQNDVQIDMEYNRVYGNDIDVDGHHHDFYMEAVSPTYKFNYAGPLTSGSTGAEFKDRSFQPTFAYNYVEGGLPFHLVEPYDTDNGATPFESMTGYGIEYVYGNTIVADSGSGVAVKFGMDNIGADAEKTLYFYLNTVVDESELTGPFYNVIFTGVLSGASQVGYIDDNIFTEYNPDSSDHQIYLLGQSNDTYNPTTTVHLGANLLPADASLTTTGDATYITTDGSSNLTYNDDPKFVNVSTGDFRVASNSPAVNAAKGFYTGSAFQTWATAGLTAPSSEIDYSQGTSPLVFASRSTVATLGAWEYVATAPTLTVLDGVFALKHDDMDYFLI